MVILDRFLTDHAVNPGGFDAFVSKKFLYLFDRHTGIEQIRCAGPPEPVRMDMFYLCGCGDSVKDIFQSAPGQPVIGRFTADEKRGVIVSPHGQVILEVDVGSGIKVGDPLFVSFSKDCDIVPGKGNVRAVKTEQLGSPDSRTVEAFHDGKIPLGFTGGADFFKLFRRQGFFEFLFTPDGIDGVNGIMGADPLFEQPLEESACG